METFIRLGASGTDKPPEGAPGPAKGHAGRCRRRVRHRGDGQHLGAELHEAECGPGHFFSLSTSGCSKTRRGALPPALTSPCPRCGGYLQRVMECVGCLMWDEDWLRPHVSAADLRIAGLASAELSPRAYRFNGLLWSEDARSAVRRRHEGELRTGEAVPIAPHRAPLAQRATSRAKSFSHKVTRIHGTASRKVR